MKLTRLRLLGIIVAVLVLGTVAFAVAVGAQAPAASQIPTVVTHQVTATPAPETLVTTPAPPSSSVATKPVTTKPSSAKPDSGAQTADHSSSQREVVTPKLRDDGDGDENGSGKNDGDADNSGASGTGGDKAPSDSGVSAKGSSSGNRGTESAAGGAKSQTSNSARFTNASSEASVRATHARPAPRSQSLHRAPRAVHIRAYAPVEPRAASGKNVPGTFRN